MPPENNVAAYIAEILDCPKLAPQITMHRLMPGREAIYGESHLPWPRAITALLEQKGIKLYAHQALATDHVRAGHSIVAATPTASGKSLIYNLPVLDSYLRDPDCKALYLFPLKALAQDQLASFNALTASWPKDARPAAALYDGDTSDYMRRKIRNNPPAALITNPEMLHLGILPFHANWTTFLAGLKYVIVDEAHTYRGVFGGNMAQVFRRLNRIAALYGVNPTYIFCTATLGNPVELAGNLMGGEEKPVLIDNSGAPTGPRHYIFFNPEQAAATCAIELLKRALAKNLRTIVYCRSRRMTELVSLWAASGADRARISSYRAGFLPEERREIEARMASGELMAVVSTSALELGIDIGGLDVCILVGYPGTIMQTLQRGGRVGRARQESVVALVAGEDALDQYFARNPDDFFARPPEKAVINPANESIMARHLECAAAERPLRANEPWLQAPGAASAIGMLEREGRLLLNAAGTEWLATRKRPQRGMDLRGSGGSHVIEDGSGAIIGVMDALRVWREAHPGAVYLHHGQSYIIERVDDGARRIFAKREKTDWFTRARSKKETHILEEYERFSIGRCAVFLGRLRIIERISGYERRQSSGNRLISVTPLEAPEQIFETEGIWLVIPDNIRLEMEKNFFHFMGSIHALEHAAIGMLPLEILADRNDFGGISTPLHYQLGLSAVFTYDGVSGGAGLAREAFKSTRQILASTLAAIKGCPCDEGCPSCIHSPKCGSGNRPLSKTGAIYLLEALLAPGREGDDICQSLQISPPGMNARGKINHAVLPAPGPVEWESGAHYVVFDVETRRSAKDVGGWHKARDMGVSVAALYDSKADEYFIYEQDQLEEMFARMKDAGLVVGFNSLRFDYEVLAPFAEKSDLGIDLRALPSLDLLKKIKEKLNYPVSLDNLAKATLDAAKSASGLQALAWWKAGKIAKIARYCRKDVELTRSLYLFGLKEKYLLFSNKDGQKARVGVDFSTLSQ